MLVVLTTSPAGAQRPQRADRFATDSTQTSTPGIAFVASAVLPGAGQFYLKSDTWVPFVALEAWAWVNFAKQRHRSRALERSYHDLAWNVARRFTTPTRKDSAFTYYEAMSEWRESGSFDADPFTPGIQPEPDSITFNGAQWLRARRLYARGNGTPGSAEYEKALAYYRANAIPDPYLWSWGTSRLEQQEFHETIGRSDDAYRQATRMMGVILANHVVSAVEALVLARVKLLDEHRIRIGSTLEPASSSTLWTMTVQFSLHGAERGRNARTNR